MQILGYQDAHRWPSIMHVLLENIRKMTKTSKEKRWGRKEKDGEGIMERVGLEYIFVPVWKVHCETQDHELMTAPMSRKFENTDTIYLERVISCSGKIKLCVLSPR